MVAEAGVRLTSAAGINAVGIAEFVIGRVLQHFKRFRELDVFQADHNWTLGNGLGTEFAGSTVGLIGLGAINSAVAQRLHLFDVKVLATRRRWSPGSTAPYVDEVLPSDALLEMLPRCDVVIAAVPETHDTYDVMDTAAFAAMKPGAFFCNVGRGSFVVEEALADALRRGHQCCRHRRCPNRAAAKSTAPCGICPTVNADRSIVLDCAGLGRRIDRLDTYWSLRWSEAGEILSLTINGVTRDVVVRVAEGLRPANFTEWNVRNHF